LAGCGGEAVTPTGPSISQQLGQGIVAGEPNGGMPIASEYIKMAQTAGCADTRNRLFMVDSKMVFWDRAGSCADNSYTMTLYGPTTQAVLCTRYDSIAGPMSTCANDANRELFDIIVKNRDAADLGLAASGHKVEQINFEALAATKAAFETAYHSQMSGVQERKDVVVKDQAEFDKLWAEIHAGQSSVPAAPYVDFNTKMVIGVFEGAGAEPCGSMAIRGVVPKLGRLVVEHEQIAAPAGIACTAVVTHPAHVIVVDRSDSRVEFLVVKTVGVPTMALDSTKHSGINTARDVVVRDQAAFAALWAEHAGSQAKAPDVDFSKWMVVGVFTGPGDGCSGTAIGQVSRDDKQVTVRHVDTVPGPATMCSRLATTPGQLLAIEASSLPVTFVKEVQQVR
jgi:hypothetical protein